MVIDTSAIMAILRGEPERISFIAAIDRASAVKIAAPTLLELTMVVAGSHRADLLDELYTFIALTDAETTSFTADHAAVARQAFLRYGEGRHPAGLNFGDCISYATARLEALPLLFKGNDFRLTDIEAAV